MGDAVLATVLALFASAVVVSIAFAVTDTTSSTDIPLWAVGLLEIPLWIGLLGVPLWATRRTGSGSLARDFWLEMRWSDVPIGLAAGGVAQAWSLLPVPPPYRLLAPVACKIGEG